MAIPHPRIVTRDEWLRDRKSLLVSEKELTKQYDAVCARGVENLNDAYRLLDCTPYGRQEDFEDSPEGWPQKPTYG